ERHELAAEPHAVGRVAGLQLELAGCAGDLLQDELRVEPHVVVVDLLAGRPEQVERARRQELDPDLADDAPPPAVEDGHRVRGQDLVARHPVDEHPDLLLTSWLHRSYAEFMEHWFHNMEL